jgi:ABC-2 type transport system ATP-binding protein
MSAPPQARGQIVVEADRVRKAYGAVAAVDGISFAVRAGEIFGVVGPNGAGKTTLLECLEGLRRPDSGSIRVRGLDPIADHDALMPLIGVQLQDAALPDRLRVGEAIKLFASFYPRATGLAALVEQLGLAGLERTPFARLSGGQKQRLLVALALLHEPEVIFLDELTTGLDPQARRAAWDLVTGIRDKGKTILLTSHYMEEAEYLCDRVAIIDHGRLVALDTPANLIRDIAANTRITFLADAEVPAAALERIAGVRAVQVNGREAVVHGEDEAMLGAVVQCLNERGIRFRNLTMDKPDLEDVFLRLTGRRIRE